MTAAKEELLALQVTAVSALECSGRPGGGGRGECATEAGARGRGEGEEEEERRLFISVRGGRVGGVFVLLSK